MQKIENNIISTIAKLESRPKMFLVEVNFLALKNFLTGYFFGIEDVTGVPYNKNISEWLNQQRETPSSLFWTEHILQLLALGDHDKAYATTLERIKTFLSENQK